MTRTGTSSWRRLSTTLAAESCPVLATMMRSGLLPATVWARLSSVPSMALTPLSVACLDHWVKKPLSSVFSSFFLAGVEATTGASRASSDPVRVTEVDTMLLGSALISTPTPSSPLIVTGQVAVGEAAAEAAPEAPAEAAPGAPAEPAAEEAEVELLEEPQATRPVLSTMAATARRPCLRRLERREDAFIYLSSFLVRPAGNEQSGWFLPRRDRQKTVGPDLR